MKILLCHNFYQQRGGEDSGVLAVKGLLQQKGHEVISYVEHSREIEKYGVLQKIGFFPRTVFSVRTYRRLCRIAAQEKPDIAHVHNVFPLLSPALYVALKRNGIPIVQTVQNFRLMCINGLFLRDERICERCRTGKFFSGFRFKCYRNSYTLSGLYALTIGSHRRWGTFNLIDRFAVVSQFAAMKIAESGVADISKISILENFLLTPLPEYGEADFANPYIVYMGRLSREKGIFTLLKAVGGLPSLRLKVMGSGPLREAIEEYIRHHRLGNVEMLGFVDGEEKYRILRGALCCVVPSEWYETFGFVVIESAAVGTPVVASRIGGLTGIISDGETGFFFAPGNSAELRDKLKVLAASPELVRNIGRQARQRAQARHTSDAHYETLMNIYGSVMKPRPMVALSQSLHGVPSSRG